MWHFRWSKYTLTTPTYIFRGSWPSNLPSIYTPVIERARVCAHFRPLDQTLAKASGGRMWLITGVENGITDRTAIYAATTSTTPSRSARRSTPATLASSCIQRWWLRITHTTASSIRTAAASRGPARRASRASTAGRGARTAPPVPFTRLRRRTAWRRSGRAEYTTAARRRVVAVTNTSTRPRPRPPWEHSPPAAEDRRPSSRPSTTRTCHRDTRRPPTCCPCPSQTSCSTPAEFELQLPGLYLANYNAVGGPRFFFHLKADTHCLKWSKKEAGSLPQAEVECPFPRIFFIYFWSENGEFWCILGGILCDLELQESKQETRYRPGKSKGDGSPTLATRPHFKPCWH